MPHFMLPTNVGGRVALGVIVVRMQVKICGNYVHQIRALYEPFESMRDINRPAVIQSSAALCPQKCAPSRTWLILRTVSCEPGEEWLGS